MDAGLLRSERRVMSWRDNSGSMVIVLNAFCRLIVDSSPSTALAVFQEIRNTKKYVSLIRPFSKNIVTEALLNKDSFLYHETEGYESGLFSYHKPLSQTMFSDCRMVEAIGTLLEPDEINLYEGCVSTYLRITSSEPL